MTEQSKEPEVVKMIKSDAIIDIKIGSGFLQKIQGLFFYLISLRTQEEMEKYKQEAETSTDLNFSEPWMHHLTTLSILLKEIETKAIEQNHTYDKNMDEAVKEIEDATNGEEN
jgi:hypothetical protein